MASRIGRQPMALVLIAGKTRQATIAEGAIRSRHGGSCVCAADVANPRLPKFQRQANTGCS